MLSEEQIKCLTMWKSAAKDIYEASLVSRGNRARIASAMRKAQRGEKVVLAVIGGSVTEGADATKEELRYTYRVFDWWRQAFPAAQFETINAGIGATGSTFGVARVDADVLAYKPDVVMVDFALNDLYGPFDVCGQPQRAETYEGVVRKILSAPWSPGVMLLFLTSRKFTNVDIMQIPTGLHYQLPMISIKNGMRYAVEKCGEDIHDLMGDSDLHPTDRGHELMADLICHEFEQIKASLDSIPTETLPLPDSIWDTRFDKTQLLDPRTVTPVHNDGWELADNLFYAYKQGWSATKAGSKISFDVEASIIFVNYLERTHNRGGIARVYLDGVEVAALKNYFRWCGRIRQCLIYDGERRKHRVDVVFTGEPFENGNGEIFELFGLITA